MMRLQRAEIRIAGLVLLVKTAVGETGDGLTAPSGPTPSGRVQKQMTAMTLKTVFRCIPADNGDCSHQLTHHKIGPEIGIL